MYRLIQIEGTGGGNSGGLGLGPSGSGRGCGGWGRSGRVRNGFEVVDFGGGDVDEIGLIAVYVKAGDVAHDFAVFVADRESVAEDGGVGGWAGNGIQGDQQESPESELEGLLHVRGIWG